MKPLTQMIWIVSSLLFSNLALAQAQAQPTAQVQDYSCSSDKFPAGFGSVLKLSVMQGEPGEASLYLQNSKGALQTRGWYRSHKGLNENQNEVIYLTWTAGGGDGEELKLIPNQMVIYALDDNYKVSKSMYVGVFHWENGDKIEKHYVFKCE